MADLCDNEGHFRKAEEPTISAQPSWRLHKLQTITNVLNNPDGVDLWRLRELALTDGGLLNHAVRRRAWPKLLGVDRSRVGGKERIEAGAETGSRDSSVPAPTRVDLDQIARDVERSIWHFPGGHAQRKRIKQLRSYCSRLRATTPRSIRRSSRRCLNYGDESGSMFKNSPVPYMDEATECGTTSSLTATGSAIGRSIAIGSQSGGSIHVTAQKPDMIDHDRPLTLSFFDEATVSSAADTTSSHGTGRVTPSQTNRNGNCNASNGNDDDNSSKSIDNGLCPSLAPSASSITPPRQRCDLRRRQKRLGRIIANTIWNPEGHGKQVLHYYQGYHDVAAVLSRVLEDAPLTVACLSVISRSHFGDAMKKDFSDLMSCMRLSIFPLVDVLDPELHDFLFDSGVEPFFALSWVITWFAHEVRDVSVAGRLFDVFLASHPALPLYMSVAMILHPIHRKKILETECDFAEVHNVLCGLPKSVKGSETSQDEKAGEGIGVARDGKNNCSDEVVDYQDLINMAISFMQKIPPSSLLSLAERYEDGSLRSCIPESVIFLFRSPPSWAVASVVPADWVLMEQLRCEKNNGVVSTLRPLQRLDKQIHRGGFKFFRSKKKSFDQYSSKDFRRAFIAAGLVPKVAPSSRRRRKISGLIIGAVSVALVAVAVSSDSERISNTRKRICNIHQFLKNDKLGSSFEKDIAKTPHAHVSPILSSPGRKPRKKSIKKSEKISIQKLRMTKQLLVQSRAPIPELETKLKENISLNKDSSDERDVPSMPKKAPVQDTLNLSKAHMLGEFSKKIRLNKDSDERAVPVMPQQVPIQDTLNPSKAPMLGEFAKRVKLNKNLSDERAIPVMPLQVPVQDTLNPSKAPMLGKLAKKMSLKRDSSDQGFIPAMPQKEPVQGTLDLSKAPMLGVVAEFTKTMNLNKDSSDEGVLLTIAQKTPVHNIVYPVIAPTFGVVNENTAPIFNPSTATIFGAVNEVPTEVNKEEDRNQQVSPKLCIKCIDTTSRTQKRGKRPKW
eukprot:CAMPEP_0194275472 /NCGR_PEP_ID=MMETSP0169-20130528/8301_1 /TAXON_ID=218684 /ORGANISM="Corethron pennatum, Strain L29A3" /LENGTH=1008 /DNA_ID=CAMNT_0039018943 /DNA_START=101 /DNA_END=3124 /DNA_ORIENTATION=+